MKSKKTTYSVVSFLLILIVSFILSGCETSRVSPDVGRANPSAPPAVPLVLTGVIADDATGARISGATVSIQGTSLTATTNASGIYTFSDISSLSAAQYVLVVSAANYGYGTGLAVIDKTHNQASSPAITLKQIVGGTSVSVTTTTGATGSTTSNEAAGPNTVKLVIPAGAVNKSTQVTLVSLGTDQSPASGAPATNNDIASVVLNPTDAVFNAPGVTITFALPYQITPGTTLPLYKVVNNTWQFANVYVTVDASGYSATGNVTSGGMYAIFDAVGVSSISGSVQRTTKTLSKNADGELIYSSHGDIITAYLPETIANSIVSIVPSNSVSRNWVERLIFKIKLYNALTAIEGTYNFSFPVTLAYPALPANRVVNGVEYNPDFPNQSGDWYYKWFYQQNAISTTLIVTKSGIFTFTYYSTLYYYSLETGQNKTGWWWVAHNQGGIGNYYGL
jgi:hypothetical protein